MAYLISSRALDIQFQRRARPFVKDSGGDPQATKLVGPNSHIQPVSTPWPGYDFPITFRQLEMADTDRLFEVMKRSSKAIRGYVSWGSSVNEWSYLQVQRFMSDHVNAKWPRFHLLFFAGNEIVGFGSIAPTEDLRAAQVALWVAKGHQGKGIGKWITVVMEWYAFNIFGFDAFYYVFDVSNTRSAAVPASLGYAYSHSFTSSVEAESESGLWDSYVKFKPEGILPGYLDTGIYGNWGQIPNPFSPR